MGCVVFCRLRDGNKIGPRISGTLCSLNVAQKFEKDANHENIKII